MAKVSPIFKNGFKSDLNNYRPITVIHTIAKIFEKKLSMTNYITVLEVLKSWKYITILINAVLSKFLELSRGQ